jgi:hypothetical protein
MEIFLYIFNLIKLKRLGIENELGKSHIKTLYWQVMHKVILLKFEVNVVTFYLKSIKYAISK